MSTQAHTSDVEIHVDSESTKVEMRIALRSLCGDWRRVRHLPCRIDYYDTLVDTHGLAERELRPLGRGSAIYYRLRPGIDPRRVSIVVAEPMVSK